MQVARTPEARCKNIGALVGGQSQMPKRHWRPRPSSWNKRKEIRGCRRQEMSRKIVDEESRRQSRDRKPSMGAERPVEEARTGCHGCRAASLRVKQLRIRISEGREMLRVVPCSTCCVLVLRMDIGVKKKKDGLPPVVSPVRRREKRRKMASPPVVSPVRRREKEESCLPPVVSPVRRVRKRK